MLGGRNYHQAARTQTAPIFSLTNVSIAGSRLSGLRQSPLPMRRISTPIDPDDVPSTLAIISSPTCGGRSKYRRQSEPNLMCLQQAHHRAMSPVPPRQQAEVDKVDLLRRVSTSSSPAMTDVPEGLHGLDFYEFTDLCESFFVQSRKDLREMFNKLNRGDVKGVCSPQLQRNCECN